MTPAWPRLLIVVAVVLVPACGNEEPPAPTPAVDKAVIDGKALLDGAPFDSQFVGAVVVRDGLVTPCQAALPPVEAGRYSIPVLGARAGAGCGVVGAEIVLWTFATDRILYATRPLQWPADGRETFTAEYSSSDPEGAAGELTQFSGPVFGPDGEALPVGTHIEAYVGETRCGEASVRRSDEFLGYVIALVGPSAVVGCTRGASVRFRVDGEDAAHNPVVNTPPGEREPIELRLRR